MAKVTDVMTRGVDPIAPDATVQRAAIQMAEMDVGAVLVGTADKLEGIITDRDIILRVVVDGRNPAEVLLRDVMSPAVFACRADDTIEAVLAEMRERQIRRMPVLDESGRPVGIVALSDVARAISSPEQVQEIMRTISEPHRERRRQEEPKTAPAGPGDAAEDAGEVTGEPRGQR